MCIVAIVTTLISFKFWSCPTSKYFIKPCGNIDEKIYTFFAKFSYTVFVIFNLSYFILILNPFRFFKLFSLKLVIKYKFKFSLFSISFVVISSLPINNLLISSLIIISCDKQ